MDELWERTRQQLAIVNPGVIDTLRAPAAFPEIQRLQRTISVPLEGLVQSLQIVNGQTSSTPPFFERFSLFSVDEIISHYQLMNEEVVPDLVDSGVDLNEGESIGPVKPQVWNPGWIPFAGDGGNFLCVDTDPDEGGEVGQVFSWWRDGSANKWEAPSYRAWLETVLDQR
jgi:cell wall assembly regulator SMI1